MTTSLDAWRARGREYRHRGHSIFYIEERRGAGPALLCIHGFPTASWDFGDIWPAITHSFGTIVAPDMIGFGFSAKPRDYTYDLMDQTDLHVGLLRSLGIDDVHVLAHDYGVSVAQELLARHDEKGGIRLRSVTFLNGGIVPEGHRPRPVQKLLLGPFGPLVARLASERQMRTSMREIFGPDTQPTDELVHAFWTLFSMDGGNKNAHKLIRYITDRRRHRDRWVGALATTNVPLRFINGPSDPVSGAHMAELYRNAVPNADVVSLPNIGHYPQVEAPDAVARAFLEFVRLHGVG